MIGLLATSVVLIGAFLISQVLIRQPLLPLRVVAERTRSGSFLGAALLNFGMMGISLFATYHLQMVMHYKPLKAGFAFLPMVGAVMVTATQVVARVMGRIPTRWLVGPGLAFTAAGVWMFTTLSEDSSYLFGVLPAWLLLGIGMGLSYSPTAHASLAGVAERDSGAVSAFQTTARQIGGAIGLALSNTLAASAAASYYADHKGQGAQDGLLTKSIVHGTATAAWWVSGVLLIGTIVCTIMINADPRKARQATADAGTDAAPDTDADTDADAVMIRGHVVWAEDVPVSEAALTLVTHDGREVARTSADRNGAYTLRAPGHGPYLLIARSDTHRSTATPLAATAGASAIEHTVTFQDEGAVTGIARDEADGAPLKGTSVILTDVNGRLIRSLSTDEDGSFLIDKLAYSPYVLVLHQDGYRPRAIDLQVSEAQQITVTAELASHARLGSLSGVVSDSEHTLVNDVRLTLTDGSGTRLTATSKEDGSFRFADVPVGNYILIAAGHPPTVSLPKSPRQPTSTTSIWTTAEKLPRTNPDPQLPSQLGERAWPSTGWVGSRSPVAWEWLTGWSGQAEVVSGQPVAAGAPAPSATKTPSPAVEGPAIPSVTPARNRGSGALRGRFEDRHALHMVRHRKHMK